ncbi:hypothetical protein [Nocardia asteroides]
MTSRQQIVQHAGYAKSDALKDLVQDSFFCAITMDDLDVATKIDMLTAHLTLSNLSDAERERARTDRRIARLAVHHSYAPRLIRTVVDRLDCSSTADEAFDTLVETFANPSRVWQASYESVSAQAQSILRTLATLMPRPVDLRRLRGLARFEGTAPDWKAALKEIEPAWIRIVDADTDKAAAFSNPSCRDYLLGLLDDEDYAEEGLAQLDCLEQLVNLAQESGVITIPRVSAALPERQNLAGTIRRYSAQLVSQVTSWMADIASEDATVAEVLNSLRDAARITSALGTSDSFGWLIDSIRDLLDSHANILPTHESLALAGHLHDTGAAGLLAAVAEDLIEAGLRGAGTSRDLWSYEALREDARTVGLELVANQTAQRIFDMEWEVLLAQPGEINEKISEGEAFHAQAQWYGIELNLGDLIDDTP